MNGKSKKEVEKKYRIDSVGKESFVQRLRKSGAEFFGKKKEIDTYFNVAGRDSLTTKECLRVREADTYIEITYKPPTENHSVVQSHFAKKETNVSVKDGKEAIVMLELIGNDVLVVVDKEREYYAIDGCTVALDCVKDGGLFVEIEIETDDELAGLEKIDVLARRLGLDASMIETLPYRDVVLSANRK
jgi:adenylate cyclase class 2